MPIKTHPISAYTFNHKAYSEEYGNYLTWDYICRACLKQGKPQIMDAWEDGNHDVWIQCPRCKTKENISASIG